MNDEHDFRVRDGELYALVAQTLLFIVAAAVAVPALLPAAGLHATTTLGLAVMTVVVGVIVLPLQRIVVRRFYEREMPLWSSLAWTIGATALVFGGWAIVRQLIF